MTGELTKYYSNDTERKVKCLNIYCNLVESALRVLKIEDYL